MAVPRNWLHDIWLYDVFDRLYKYLHYGTGISGALLFNLQFVQDKNRRPPSGLFGHVVFYSWIYLGYFTNIWLVALLARRCLHKLQCRMERKKLQCSQLQHHNIHHSFYHTYCSNFFYKFKINFHGK